MRTTWAQVERILRNEVGYVETPINRTKYGAWLGLDGVPWCAEFVSWAFYVACHANGERSPFEGLQRAFGTAYSGHFLDWGRRNGRYGKEPRTGAVVVYDWDRVGSTDHVGVVTGFSNTRIQTIEGNTSFASQNNGGQVMVRDRPRDASIVGYAYPDYGTAQVPPATAPPWPGRLLALSSPYTRGQDVATWQRRMRDRGWRVQVDGIYGPSSADVCGDFQREKGLQDDQVVGPVTWNASWTLPVT